MTGASSAADIKTIEGLLADVPEASSTVGHVASMVKDGQAADGEFRLARAIRPGSDPGGRWYRLSARAFDAPGRRQPLFAWTLADVSSGRLPKPVERLAAEPEAWVSRSSSYRSTQRS